jgi:ABC-2 type transport system ATP-binding protein
MNTIQNNGKSSAAIEVQNLSLHYGALKAVDDISFEVQTGEIFGFLGQNGAGKTTTIKVLSTLLSPTSGNVKILGYDVTSQGMDIRKRIGMVQQKLVYEYFLTVERALNIYALLWNIPKSVSQKKIDDILESFDLTDKRKSPMTELSIGLQRRVQVAQEFIHDPELLFLDEPTVGLDPIARRSTLEMIKKKTEEGLTVFYTTHLLEEADYLCERIAIIVKGKIAVLDTPKKLKRRIGGIKSYEIGLGDSPKEKIEDFIKVLQDFDDGHSQISDLKISPDNSSLTLVSECEHHAEQRVCGSTLSEIVKLSENIGVRIETVSTNEPSLEDAFIEVLRANGN